MTIKIVATQECDYCHAKRELAVDSKGGVPQTAILAGGWRPIDRHHLCNDCIEKLFNEG